MGRRSDHTPEELRELLIQEGLRQMARTGFEGFSARAVAAAAGYSVGTISNIFGNVDGLVLAINARTFKLWTDHLVQALADCGRDSDRIATLVRAYFSFAAGNTNLWMAIYDHRRPGISARDEPALAARKKLIGLIESEVARFLGCARNEKLRRLTASLVAIVHGHCALALSGSMVLMGEHDACGQAVERVHDVLAAKGGRHTPP